MLVSSEMIEIMGPAFVAGLIIALTHAPLGIEVLKRGIIFIDLAIAQIAGLGLITVNIFFPESSEWAVQITALLFAIIAGLFFRLIETAIPQQLEAIIGCSFVFSASLALLFIANSPHGSEEIQHLLSGDILFITWESVIKHIVTCTIILALWFIRPSIKNGIGFYIIFSAAITLSVQAVGVYVVFASLILPALVAINTKYEYANAWIYGITSLSLGIWGATMFDMPAGPMIVISYVFMGFMYVIFKIFLLRAQSIKH